MDVFLDPSVGRSKTAALFDQLRDAIVTGRLAVGDTLPPSRTLAAELDVSRTTITTVYGRLAAEGYISGRTGAGSTVVYRHGSPNRTTRAPAALRPVNLGVVAASDWSLGGFDNVEPTFDLRTGRPDPALFPLIDWRRAMNDALHTLPGSYRNPAGQPTLRRALARWVGRSRGVEADADQIIVTAGAQQGIDLVGRLLIRPGETVAVEDPGYPPVSNLFKAQGATVVPTPVDRDGIQVEHLPADTRLVYVTPSHQSPTGAVMSLQRRAALLDFAETNDVAIIEDDYDSEYRHSDRPLEPLYRLDRHGRVIYVGTFSKTLSPSLRLGFLALPPSLLDDAIALRSLMDWQPPEASQTALHRFIVDGHLDRHLKRTRRDYTQRYALVTEALHAAADHGHIQTPPPHHAGLHVTAHLNDGVTEHDVRTNASLAGIALGNYRQCWQGDPTGEVLLIGFGATSTDELPKALDALLQAITTANER